MLLSFIVLWFYVSCSLKYKICSEGFLRRCISVEQHEILFSFALKTQLNSRLDITTHVKFYLRLLKIDYAKQIFLRLLALFLFAGGAEDAIQRHVLGLGVTVHILVVEEFSVLELLVAKGLAVLVISLITGGVTLIAVQ